MSDRISRTSRTFGLPLQGTLAAGMILLAPMSDRLQSNAQGLEDFHHPALVTAIASDTFHTQVLTTILADYHTFLSSEEKERLPHLIVEISERYGYHPFFVAGIMETESSFNNRAISSANARGLMQIIPYVGEALARELGFTWSGPETLHIPEINIELGLYYLRQLEERFGDLDLALAAYNMGPTLLSQRMATGFRPHGVYAGRVNAAYQSFRGVAREFQDFQHLEARL